MAEGLEQAIRENAQGLKRAQGDAGSAEQHSLKDQIAADRYLASKAAAMEAKRGLRFSELLLPGSARRTDAAVHAVSIHARARRATTSEYV